MATAIALRSFDHNGKVTKGEDVSDKFDVHILRALKRSGLVSLDEGDKPAPAKPEAPKAPVPTVGSLGKAPKPKTGGKAPKVGAKSSASQAAPALPPVTSTPSAPGDLPPPLPVV